MFVFLIKFFAIGAVFFVIWALFDCLKYERERLRFWLFVILVLGIFGAIPYSIRAGKRRNSFLSYRREMKF